MKLFSFLQRTKKTGKFDDHGALERAIEKEKGKLAGAVINFERQTSRVHALAEQTLHRLHPEGGRK